MTTLICPRCRQRLTVSELAPQRLTCPNCLGRLINPRWREPVAPAADSVPVQTTPRRVIPLDYQVARDTRGSSVILVAFAVILAVASFVSFQLPHGGKIGGLLALFAVVSAVTVFLQWRFSKDEPVGAVASAVGDSLSVVARGCVVMTLIAVGLLDLLLGACAIMLSGSNWHGS